MTPCYICRKPKEITETVAQVEVCRDCLRKVQRCIDELEIEPAKAVEIIKYFQQEREKQ